MKLQTQRWIDRWVGQLLCAAVSGWARLSQRGRPTPVLAAAPKHLLVILLSEMGSVVLAGPLFAALRQRYPGVTLHVLQLKKNQEVAALLGLARPEHLHALDDSSALTLLVACTPNAAGKRGGPSRCWVTSGAFAAPCARCRWTRCWTVSCSRASAAC